MATSVNRQQNFRPESSRCCLSAATQPRRSRAPGLGRRVDEVDPRPRGVRPAQPAMRRVRGRTRRRAAAALIRAGHHAMSPAGLWLPDVLKEPFAHEASVSTVSPRRPAGSAADFRWGDHPPRFEHRERVLSPNRILAIPSRARPRRNPTRSPWGPVRPARYAGGFQVPDVSPRRPRRRLGQQSGWGGSSCRGDDPVAAVRVASAATPRPGRSRARPPAIRRSARGSRCSPPLPIDEERPAASRTRPACRKATSASRYAIGADRPVAASSLFLERLAHLFVGRHRRAGGCRR